MGAMKQLFLLFTFLIFSSSGSSQNTNVLNGYKYIYISNSVYQNIGYNIPSEATKYFQKKGFGILTDNIDLNNFKDVKNNKCIVLTCNIQYEYNVFRKSVTFTFTNCYNQFVYSSRGSTDSAFNISRAIRKALDDFNEHDYVYNSDITPKIIYPVVEKTNLTGKSLKEYFSNSNLDPIEGIYKSYQSKSLPHYKIGIKKFDSTYKAIIIESEYKHWEVGEVKAYFERTSMKDLYSTEWFMGNKTKVETFSTLRDEIILSIQFDNLNTNEKYTSEFIKLYPSSNVNIKNEKKTKSSGSGFFVTTDGVIATNAHVVQDSETIKVQISNEIGSFEYSAKILLIDNRNDVALLKINDDKFKELSHIPYSFQETGEIGEEVFTIGYPLNTVMGTNYKVTDGIISSTSGINDDMRYYQISVPLQPGNSGGPLFNTYGDVIGITSSRLNGKAIGTEIENVNYAIKIAYLLDLYNMLPNHDKLNMTNSKTNKELKKLVKSLKYHVCLIRVN